MINIEHHWLEINCPNCKYGISIKVQNIKLEEICYCHNCKKSIQLIDSNASAYTSVNTIDEEFKKLNKALKNLFK